MWSARSGLTSSYEAITCPHAYGMELHGQRQYEFLGFSTDTRPHAGTFRVYRWRPEHEVHGDFYTAIMSLSSNSDDMFMSDSGSLALKSAGTGFDGHYIVYVTADSNPRLQKARHYVVRGTFHLKKKD